MLYISYVRQLLIWTLCKRAYHFNYTFSKSFQDFLIKRNPFVVVVPHSSLKMTLTTESSPSLHPYRCLHFCEGIKYFKLFQVSVSLYFKVLSSRHLQIQNQRKKYQKNV